MQNSKNSIIPGIFQELSGTAEFLLKWTIFCQIQHIGCFSHSIFGPELDFQPWITHKEKTWSSLELACFCQFQSIGYYSILVFIFVHNFQCFNLKFHHFWNLPGTLEFLCKWHVLVIFPTQFSALNLILNAEFQNCIIPGILYPNVMILWTLKMVY